MYKVKIQILDDSDSVLSERIIDDQLVAYMKAMHDVSAVDEQFLLMLEKLDLKETFVKNLKYFEDIYIFNNQLK